MFAAFLFAAAATVQPTFPLAANEALCKVYIQTPERERADFWKRADAEFGLDDRQKIQVRTFCLGYQRGLLAKALAKR